MMIPLRYNVRSILVRRVTSLATAIGVGLVVFVLAAALMLAEGVERTLGAAGREDVAIVLRRGSDAELGSGIDDPKVGLIKAMPGVKRVENEPVGVGEVVVVAAMEKEGTDGGITNVQIRGVTDGVENLRPNVKVIQGRKPSPGADEVMIGARIKGRFKGIDLGQTFELKKNRPLNVVGVFEDGGSAHESEVWVDSQVLKTSFGREGSVSSVRVVLDSPAAFDGFQAAVEQDKRLGLLTMRETTYYENHSKGTSLFISILGSIVAFFFSIGAMIGASNTMYAAVANRRREIGTLRALGFSRFAILTCFLVEAVILAVVGGALGTLAAMALGTVKFSMLNFASWSEIVFTFDATTNILVTSFVAAVIMGILGGFLPAVRAARVSAIDAMRG